MNRSMVRILVAVSVPAVMLTSALPSHADGNGMDTARAGLSSKSIDTSAATGSGSTKFEKASAAQQAIATGHFARARSLLIAALNEFDSGVRKADPSSLIDTGMFREGIKSRARELERVLDPQARESETGAKFQADARLLKHK